MPLPTELDELHQLIALGGERLSCRRLLDVGDADGPLPVTLLALGSDDPQAPAIGFFGGVHGLERIGSAVVLAFLQHLLMRLPWDRSLQFLLEHVRLLFVPVVNPGGLARGTRANPQGVDLMRNAPVDAVCEVPWLVGGHRIGPSLPWYRGAIDAPMQPESAVLCEAVQRELLGRPLAISVDCHSGFGMRDRIWFPYAHTRTPIRDLAELHALVELFERSHPNHRYICEPQSAHYLAHGDLWDYLHLQPTAARGVFLPLTLELGSWRWVRKNPLQLLSRHGLFNPQVLHRRQRALRGHLGWLDFLVRAACSHQHWMPHGDLRRTHLARAMARWYAA